MFILTLPANAQIEGTCRINGKPAKYKFSALPDGHDKPEILSFRHEDTDPWQVRYVRDVTWDRKNVTWVCTEAPDEDIVLFQEHVED